MARPDQPDGDYGYDLAHEDLPPPVAPRPASDHPVVTRQPQDSGGDLSYDLAHDVPPSGGS